jgi:carbamate kinase
MEPKVEAAVDFVEATGHRAVIGALDDLPAILESRGGTVVVPEGG